MSSGGNDAHRELHSRLKQHAQEHVLRFWDRLSHVSRRELASQVESLDLPELEKLFHQPSSKAHTAELARRADAPPAIRLGNVAEPCTRGEALERGAQTIQAAKLGVVLVAGGQGTRLGFHRPKGMFPVGAVSGSTLFRILFEKVLALSRRYGVRIPVYLMTSDATHDETVEYLAKECNFGLADDDVHLFRQGTMPALDRENGQLLLAGHGQLALSPDGHGGLLRALVCSGKLQHMQSRGVEQIFYLQVDNPLVRIGDEEFLGFHLITRSEMSTQAVVKRTPTDRVGNIVSCDGRVQIIEYSDLPDEAAERRADDGGLLLWAGNTAVHIIERTFLERVSKMADGLPFHLAHKKVAFMSEAGEPVEPEAPNAIKFERFIFDLLPLAERALVVEIDEQAVFAPVKNASGEARDTPETVRHQMTQLFTSWLAAAGVEVQPGVPVEISPLYALDAEQLAAHGDLPKRITQPTFLG